MSESTKSTSSGKRYCKSCSDFDSVLILPAGATSCGSCGGKNLGDLEVLEKAHLLVNHVVQRNHRKFVRDVELMNFLHAYPVDTPK